MQQWLNLVPMAGALLNLAAAMTNLAATIMNRRGTTSDRVDSDIARPHRRDRRMRAAVAALAAPFGDHLRLGRRRLAARRAGLRRPQKISAPPAGTTTPTTAWTATPPMPSPPSKAAAIGGLTWRDAGDSCDVSAAAWRSCVCEDK